MTNKNNKEIEVRFKDQRGEIVTLTGSIVRQYISTDPNVTDKEIFMFLQLAKFMHLNPFLKEIYLVKFKGQPAQYVVSYHTLLMRAEAHEQYDGMEVKIEGKEPPDLKATAVVYRKDRSHPTVVEIEYNEAVRMLYDPRTHQKRPMGPWATMPKWMLRKTAIARALREAFPGIVGPAVVQTTDNTAPTEEVKPYRQITEEEAEEMGTDLYGDLPEDAPQRTEKQTEETETETETETEKPATKTEKNKASTVKTRKKNTETLLGPAPMTPQQRNVILILASKLELNTKEVEKRIEGASFEEAKEIIANFQEKWRKKQAEQAKKGKE